MLRCVMIFCVTKCGVIMCPKYVLILQLYNTTTYVCTDSIILLNDEMKGDLILQQCYSRHHSILNYCYVVMHCKHIFDARLNSVCCCCYCCCCCYYYYYSSSTDKTTSAQTGTISASNTSVTPYVKFTIFESEIPHWYINFVFPICIRLFIV